MARRSDKPSVPSLEAHLGYWLRLVSNHISGAFARALQERHLSLAEWVALNNIQYRAYVTAAALADVMGMTRGAISKVLEKLESKDLIQRTTSQEDSRVQHLSLTRPGQRLLPRLSAIADSNDSHFFAPLDHDEKAMLRALMEKLAHAHQMSTPPVD